jgi:hypothetical protein
MAEVEREIAGLVDRSTNELRLAWRKFHHAGPPPGLSRDLMIRTLATKLQQRAWRPEPRVAAPPADPSGRVGERRSFFRSRHGAEDRRELGAAVARSYPYRPCARGRVRIRRPALSLADRDRRADHRGTLVGPTLLWRDQAGTCILVAEAANEKSSNQNAAERNRPLCNRSCGSGIATLARAWRRRSWQSITVCRHRKSTRREDGQRFDSTILISVATGSRPAPIGTPP